MKSLLRSSRKPSRSFQAQLSALFSRPLPTVMTPPSSMPPDLLIDRITQEITGRTVIVVDNSNIFRGADCKGYRLDFGSPLFYALGGDQLVAAHFFASAPPADTAQYDSQYAFYEFLRQVGWVVHLFKLLRQEGGYLENEEAVDGGVCSAVRQWARTPHIDTIVLLTGDGRMTAPVSEAIQAGKKVVVLAWAGTVHPALVSVASAYFDLDDLRGLIEKRLS